MARDLASFSSWHSRGLHSVGWSSVYSIVSVAVMRRQVNVLSPLPVMVSLLLSSSAKCANTRVDSSGLVAQHSGSMVRADLVSNGRRR